MDGGREGGREGGIDRWMHREMCKINCCKQTLHRSTFAFAFASTSACIFVSLKWSLQCLFIIYICFISSYSLIHVSCRVHIYTSVYKRKKRNSIIFVRFSSDSYHFLFSGSLSHATCWKKAMEEGWKFGSSSFWNSFHSENDCMRVYLRSINRIHRRTWYENTNTTQNGLIKKQSTSLNLTNRHVMIKHKKEKPSNTPM